MPCIGTTKQQMACQVCAVQHLATIGAAGSSAMYDLPTGNNIFAAFEAPLMFRNSAKMPYLHR
jgi:hypothetical protein